MSVPNGYGFSISLFPFLYLFRAPARKGLACAGLALVLATASQAHPPWTRIAQRISWTPDLSWGPRPFGAKGPSRLVESGEGRLFLTVGDSLYVGMDGGRVWEAVPISSESYNYGRRLALAANLSGLVLWGERISHDFGRTWDPPRIPVTSLADVYSIVGDRILGGGMYDFIIRSEDAGLTWKHVHQGRTYGTIMDFAYTWKGWYLAAPQTDQVLASRDGIAWTDLATQVTKVSGPGAPGGNGLAASILTVENMAYDQILWMVERTMSGKPSLAEIRIGVPYGGIRNDSLSLVRHAAVTAPDSAVTSFGIYSANGGNLATLWLGTWGQGVFMSHDRGETWQAWNAGLGDLHVEALLVPRHGWNDSVYALTPDGLYRLGAAPSGLAPAARHPDRASGRGSDHASDHNQAFRSGFLMDSPSGTRFRGARYRADGRRAALPGNKP
jgi:hypothetical protein